MRHFASLWDINYCAKGLALHESLLRHSSEPFTLHILSMDMETFWLLSEMKLANVELIPLESFETALKLKPVKESRSWAEFCWTCASSLMEYLLPWHESITYLDADIFFFSDPKVIYEEIAEKSIGIVPHRFSDKERKRLGGNGEFNVGVVYARNGESGLKCINKWAAQSREWCFSRNESGKFGDQAYLDSWPTDYPCEVCVISHLGVNLGPWSIGNFSIDGLDSDVAVTYHVPDTAEAVNYTITDYLVCYHFHEFQGPKNLTNWRLRPEDFDLIYRPYIKAFTEAQERIKVVKARIEARHMELAERGA